MPGIRARWLLDTEKASLAGMHLPPCVLEVAMNPQNRAIEPQEVSHIHIVRPSRRRPLPKPIEALPAENAATDEQGPTEQAA
jgi:hypothetical protein